MGCRRTAQSVIDALKSAWSSLATCMLCTVHVCVCVCVCLSVCLSVCREKVLSWSVSKRRKLYRKLCRANIHMHVFSKIHWTRLWNRCNEYSTVWLHRYIVLYWFTEAAFTNSVVRSVLRHVLGLWWKLRCLKMILRHVLSQFTKFVLVD